MQKVYFIFFFFFFFSFQSSSAFFMPTAVVYMFAVGRSKSFKLNARHCYISFSPICILFSVLFEERMSWFYPASSISGLCIHHLAIFTMKLWIYINCLERQLRLVNIILVLCALIFASTLFFFYYIYW